MDAILAPGTRRSTRAAKIDYASAEARKNAALEDEEGFPYGGMISFRIKGGAREAEAFLTSTKLFTLAESLGGVESLAELPAQMTHGSIPPAEREKLGITDNLIRLSVGVEEEEDLVADVEQALEAAAAVSKAAPAV